MIALPSSGLWDEKDLIGNPLLPMFVEVVSPVRLRPAPLPKPVSASVLGRSILAAGQPSSCRPTNRSGL
jgi:hypothetical protein